MTNSLPTKGKYNKYYNSLAERTENTFKLGIIIKKSKFNLINFEN